MFRTNWIFSLKLTTHSTYIRTLYLEVKHIIKKKKNSLSYIRALIIRSAKKHASRYNSIIECSISHFSLLHFTVIIFN